MTSLLRYVEPIDVAAGAFAVFDADARTVRLETSRRPGQRYGIPRARLVGDLNLNEATQVANAILSPPVGIL